MGQRGIVIILCWIIKLLATPTETTMYSFPKLFALLETTIYLVNYQDLYLKTYRLIMLADLFLSKQHLVHLWNPFML